MGEQPKRTLRDLASPHTAQQPVCITYPETISPFELKLGLIHLLPTFNGHASEDSHKHLKEFQVVCDGMHPYGVIGSNLICVPFPSP